MKYRKDNSHIEIETPSGDGKLEQFKLIYDEVLGEKRLEQLQPRNWQEEINSHKESTSLKRLIYEYENGNLNALNRVQSFYGDFTEVPKTQAELLNRILDAEDYFAHLPKDLKNEFDNSPEQFFSSMGTPKYTRVMAELEKRLRDANKMVEPKPKTKESEVIE